MKTTINNTNINYQIIGEGHPILMIHGYTIDSDSMIGCMEPLFNKRDGFKRIYFDLPGMGKSGTNADISHSDHMLEIVLKFIEHIIPHEPFTIAGYSYGGYLSRGVLAKLFNRVNGLFLLCPAIDFLREKRNLPEFKLFDQDKSLLSELSGKEFQEMDRFIVKQTRYVWERYKEEIIPSLKRTDPELIERVRDTEFSFDPDTLPSSFNKPALFLLGKHDVSVGYKDALRLYDDFSDGTFVVVSRGGHCLQLEQPELFNAHVSQWLDNLADLS